ncbi:restriction endonuclease [Sphingobacterium oryzagri]|uniref:Restriction endonuclease n=1 Tax=Sphingobacterium oryzagri TaxID=3025669 RepID=A0ABY7WM55_9SPHI|nr:restriction endonuclease [Sphingobacterium sp. KACC 22765]WDF70686.1 restriction endonuclease [Sphingobacterium sp. KACC 22765]
MRVKKYSGELVPFNPDSLRHSLSRSGATKEQVDGVYRAIQAQLYDGISTRELYELAFDCLKKQREVYAARYSLKKALRELGPEGFYFERWIAKLFADDGYETLTSQTIRGHAVTHEVDVVAAKANDLLAIECKFRNDVDAKISVTTPMYFMSRLKDISALPFRFFGREHMFTKGWLVTNAYFTSDAKSFGEYYQLNLLSWDYPADKSIKLRVDDNGLYPITCLTTLSAAEKAVLLKHACILVRDLIQIPKFLQHVDLSKEQAAHVLMEAQELLQSPVNVE